jgi:ribosomal-protein-alanine N-acetyltransferase
MTTHPTLAHTPPRTPLELFNITPDRVRDLGDPAEFQRAHRLRFGEHASAIADLVAQSETYRAITGASPEWGGYLAVDPLTRLIVGACAFKGSPDSRGEVEIAYHTFPSFEGLGYATAMAAALVELAVASGAVRTIVALTLPEPSASTAILARNGFVRAGNAIDPDEGPVWRWELPLG